MKCVTGYIETLRLHSTMSNGHTRWQGLIVNDDLEEFYQFITKANSEYTTPVRDYFNRRVTVKAVIGVHCNKSILYSIKEEAQS